MSTIKTTTSATRDLTGVAGQIEFETDTSNVVVNDGSNWRHFRRLGDIQDLTNESDILNTNTNPPNGYATLVYGADTNSFYVNHDGVWYTFNNDTSEPFADLQSITTTNTESQILSSDPAEYTIEQASDTHNLFVRYNDMWFKYEYIMPNSYSLSFDGTNQYLAFDALSSSISNLTAVSYSCWYKGTDTAGYIFRASPSDSPNPHIGMSITIPLDGSNIATLYTTISNGSTIVYGTHGAAISDNDWHHLAVTFDGSTGVAKSYVDGNPGDTLQTTNGMPSTVGAGYSAANIGRRPTESYLYTAGLIDDFAIFDTALTSSDITNIYNNGVPTDLSSYSPMGWWRMGEDDSGTGTTITDRGSGGNNGTLVNGPTFSSDVPKQ